MDNFCELKNIEGLKEGAVIKLVEGKSKLILWVIDRFKLPFSKELHIFSLVIVINLHK